MSWRWDDTWIVRLSHIQEAGRKYCSAFVTLVFIFSLPFTARNDLGPPCCRELQVRGEPGVRQGGGRGDQGRQGDGQDHGRQSHGVYGLLPVR